MTTGCRSAFFCVFLSLVATLVQAEPAVPTVNVTANNTGQSMDAAKPEATASSSSANSIAPTPELHLKNDSVRGDGTSMGEATGHMVLGLGAVLALIFVLAWAAKRLNLNVGSVSTGMKVVASLNVGQKEKLLLVEVEGERLLLGVTAGQISLLKTMGAQDGVESKGDFADKMQAMLKSGSLHEKP